MTLRRMLANLAVASDPVGKVRFEPWCQQGRVGRWAVAVAVVRQRV